MERTLERSLAAGLSLACASMLFIGVVQYRTMRGLVETSFWVTHTDRVLAEIEATLAATESAETLARGYALSAQHGYLEELQQAITSANTHEHAVRSMTADNPRQQQRLDVFERLLAHRFVLLNELAAARRDRGLDAAAQIVSGGQGNEFLLSIKTVGQELKNEEYFLLKLRTEAVRGNTTRALAVIAAGTLTGLILVVLAGMIMHHDVKKRQQVERRLMREKHLLATLLDNLPDSVFFKDLMSRFTRINKATARWLGLNDTGEAVGKTDADFFSKEHAQAALADEQEIIRSGQAILGKEQLENWPDRPDSWVTVSKLPLYDAEGQLEGTFGISRDMTARKRSERALEDANAKLTGWVGELEVRDRESVLLSEMSELLQTCVNEEEAQKIISQFARNLFPNHAGALCLIKSSRNLVDTTVIWGDAATAEGVFAPEQCWGLRRGRLHYVGQAQTRPTCNHLRKEFSGAYLCVPMMAHGEALGILHLSSKEAGDDAVEAQLRALAATVAERVGLALANLKLREALRVQSIRDPLTGLFNRRYMEESLERELRRAERNQKSVGAIMIDLDHFKRFNDGFGHGAGDLLLREFGNLLRIRTRKEDIACRYGGEEFLLILPDATLEDIYRRAEELREAVKHLDLSSSGQSFGAVTASMGVAMFPEHAKSIESLLRAADTALYQAKAAGRDRVLLAAEVYA